MKTHGYVIVDQVNRKAWVVKDTTQAAKVVGVGRTTLYHWFVNGRSGYVHKTWMICKDYEYYKSTRGGDQGKANLIPKEKKEEG